MHLEGVRTEFIVIRIQHYLGDEVITQSWADPSSDVDMAWLHFWEGEAKKQDHPLAKLVVTHYQQTKRYEVLPEDPRPLHEVL